MRVLYDEIKSVKFRLKDNGWYTRCIEVNTKNTVYRIKNNDSAYQQLHFRGLSTNKVCGICPYDRFPREGDITIGDFWNIDKFNKKLDDNKGTSLIFLNTIQGKELMNSIKTQFKLNKHVPINWSFNGNKNLILPIRHRNRRQFFYNLDKLTLEDNYSQCLRDTCDCAVLNNAITSVNYGSMLTAYAIQETLLKLGFFAKIINTSRIPIKNYENTFGYAFTDEYLNLTEKCDNNDDFIMLNNKTKNFLVGSDQMWRIKYLGHMIDKCLLDFVESSKNKISISVSFGLDKLEGNYLDKEHFKRSLQTFKALSTREKSGVNICRELGYNAEWLLDPVFLLDKEKYFDMIKYSNCDCSDKLVYYMWEQSDETKQCIDYLSKKLKCKSYDITSKKLNVENWLSAINSCKYFVSNSYHGICFAIIFHKPFLCINNMGVARFDSLKDLFHIEKQIITNCNLLYKSDAYLEKVNFDYIDKIIHKEKLKALEFLERNIVN